MPGYVTHAMPRMLVEVRYHMVTLTVVRLLMDLMAVVVQVRDHIVNLVMALLMSLMDFIHLNKQSKVVILPQYCN